MWNSQSSGQARNRFPQFCTSLCSSLWLLVLLCGCNRAIPSVSFTKIPDQSLGGRGTQGTISGRVSGSKPGDRIMIFARTDRWWVQPDAHNQLIPIGPDGEWTSQIHLGSEYAAVLIRGHFVAKESSATLPAPNDNVLAVSQTVGTPTLIQRTDHSPRILQFSGYEWLNEYRVSDYTGINHYYLPQNAHVDERGALHLRIRRLAGDWTCAEAHLPRTLGYGTYRVSFETPVAFDPTAEFAMYTYSASKETPNHREMEFHLSRWGEPETSNAEFVIEPYYIPANVHRFELSPGTSATTLKWGPGKAEYTAEGQLGKSKRQVTHWTFAAGVPASKDENVYLSLCPFGYPKQPERNEAEIVVKSFEFVP